MNYTHNLKVLLFDADNKLVEDQNVLNEMKNILCQNNTVDVLWNEKYQSVTIKWDKIELGEISKHLIGDLFACPVYGVDTIILQHTKSVISKIKHMYDNKYTIAFHVSGIIGDRKIISDSYGLL